MNAGVAGADEHVHKETSPPAGEASRAAREGMLSDNERTYWGGGGSAMGCPASGCVVVGCVPFGAVPLAGGPFDDKAVARTNR